MWFVYQVIIRLILASLRIKIVVCVDWKAAGVTTIQLYMDLRTNLL